MKKKEPLFKVSATGPEILAKAKELQSEFEAGKKPVLKLNATGAQFMKTVRKIKAARKDAKSK